MLLGLEINRMRLKERILAAGGVDSSCLQRIGRMLEDAKG